MTSIRKIKKAHKKYVAKLFNGLGFKHRRRIEISYDIHLGKVNVRTYAGSRKYAKVFICRYLLNRILE